jgi:ferredoxin-NADP reductase
LFEGIIMKGWDTRYLEKIERAEGTKSFRFQRPEDLNYLPGQYFFISIPKENRQLIHHFSFSSSPTEPHIEFTTRIRDSEFKKTMDSLRPGSRVHIREVLGDFILDESMKKVVYLCGGIGITPARSTIRWARDTESDLDVVLLYANRNQSSTAFREELESLSGDHLRVYHILSHPEEGWEGSTGHINAEFVRTSVPDWRERNYFVSGPPALVTAMGKVLQEDMGISMTQIKMENFLGY